MSADGDKAIHPFFTRPKDNDHIKQDASNADQTPQNDPNGEESDYEEKPKRGNSKRKKAKDDKPTGKAKGQRTLGEVINPRPAEAPQPDVVNLVTSEPDFNDERRKRRRTSQTESVDVGSEQPSTPPNGDEAGHYSPQVIISTSSPLPHASGPGIQSDESVVPKTPPKKLLKLNANGKFSSPPSKAVKIQEEPESDPPKRRTRQRKTTIGDAERHLLVKISYGSGTEVGNTIARILHGEERIPTSSRKKLSPKKRTPQKPKPTHPFFVGKKDQSAPPKQESPRKASAATPGKLRMQTAYDRSYNSKEPTFDSALLKDRLMVKHPGAKDPPFPSQDNTHVRGSDRYWVKQPMNDETFNVLYHKRKRKQARLPFPAEQSILSQFASHLSAEAERKLRPDGFYEPSEELFIPDRLLISGEEIAEKVAGELSVPLGPPAQDELSLTSSQLAVHPALRMLHGRIPDTMTAFDELRGESSSWAQKYAPTSGAEVLQPEQEIAVLKEWLNSLSVQAVSGAAAAPSKQSTVSEKPKKKRKKKPDDLDDFLVESDGDTNEMSEIADEITTNLSGDRRVNRSIVQVVNDKSKLSNAVLLSGPHGCGKSAAAYAVAKEMGYKVFEISSSERRSGKDVLERVGDMTENHLVRHHGSESAEVSSSEEPNRIDEAFQKDLQSGRQGKMSAFFKPKAQSKAKPKPKEPKNVVKEKTLKAVKEALQKQPKDQQQSLILLEEVDILFKDDKEFWTTILKLITTSKRPFIMTCNDEHLVPLQAMSLHAILRFQQPHTDLASDYMLLIAAAEGHLVPRSAVTALYERHGYDLRASITELNYWCQMGVGDPREGLGWMYQRWPPGSDLNEKGRRLRVVSNGTYQQGMGIASKSTITAEETLFETWEEFDVEPTAALGWRNAPDETQSTGNASVKQMSKLADALSAANSSCARGLPATVALDPTQPELPEKARSNYIQGLEFLQTDESIDYSSMSKELMVAMTLSAFRQFDPPEHLPSKDEIIANATQLKAHPEEDVLSRHTFSCFDAISAPAEVSLANPGLLQSAFDGPLETITLDLAPYVRAIVHHDQALEEQRERLNLLTSDGRKAKRARTTRAARSAQEGGQRATTRRERWFTKDLNFDAVLATGGKDWPRMSDAIGSIEEESRVSTDAAASSVVDEEIKYE